MKDVTNLTEQLLAFDFFFARNSFAGLVAYRAASFASGLTGASAFATSGNFLISGFRDRFNHNNVLPKFLIGFCTTIIIYFFQNCKRFTPIFLQFSRLNLLFYDFFKFTDNIPPIAPMANEKISSAKINHDKEKSPPNAENAR